MVTSQPPGRGPYLAAALLCEKVLTEQDGVKSAIRIVDRVTRTVMGPRPPEHMEPFDYEINLLIKLKSGEVTRGVHTITVSLVKPSSESLTPMVQSALFEGEEDRGVDIVANLRIRFDQHGIYWFNIYFDETTLLSKIPFRVIYMPQITQMSASGGGPTRGQESPSGG